MGPTGWRNAMRVLARDAMRVLVTYALALQMLAPIAVARAAADEPLVIRHSLCSAMLPIDVDQPTKAPEQAAHNCLLCCLANAVGILPTPVELAAPLRLVVDLWLTDASVVVDLTPDTGTPPQRAPPVRA